MYLSNIENYTMNKNVNTININIFKLILESYHMISTHIYNFVTLMSCYTYTKNLN